MPCFLGAGAIIRQGLSVRGVTTAASIWSTAALGVAVGAGQYLLGVGAAVLMLATLVALRVVRNLLRRVSVTQGEVVLRTASQFDLKALLDVAQAENVSVRGVEQERHNDGDRVTLVVKMPRGVPIERFCQQLLRLDGVREVDWES